MASNITQAISSGDLVDLVSSSGAATIFPSDDGILSVLQARFRADLPYTSIGTTNLVVVNPYKTLASVNDVSARDYEERCYKDTSLPMVDSPKPLQPHVYEFAAKIYLLMRRRNQSQAVVSRGITGSGKSSTTRLLVDQILRLSTHSKRETKVAEQIKALGPLLDAFGNAKTLLNSNASRHGRYLELHFNDRGRISSAKVLTFGLDKSRLTRLSHEERSYHVFYQFLAGATPAERDTFNLEDPSDYALLASSGCYRLPSGPFSDDSIAMNELRASMRSLGFKSKHQTAIFTLLVAILVIGNIQFGEGDAQDVSAYVSNPQVLEQAARLLGVSSEDLSHILTNKTSYVRKELYTVLLNPEQSAAQRDHLIRDLYAILFAFVVETANHKIAPNAKDPPSENQIIVLDQAGFQSRGPVGAGSMAFTGNAPLVSAYGQNGFDEFCINFADEIVNSYVLRNTFEDGVGYNGQMVGDGVSLPTIAYMDNSACVELLRGAQLSERAHRKPGGMIGAMSKASSNAKSGKDNDRRDEELLQELNSKFGVHASFAANPGPASERTLFGVNHYAGPCSYDVNGFVEKDTDMLDSAFVSLLRNSSEMFVSKLLSGPSLAAERHSKDESIVVQAQVSSRPLRQPTLVQAPSRSSPTTEEHPHLDSTKTYPVTTQINYTLSEIVSNLDRTQLWTLSCIRPNDSGSSNSFDKRRVKAQIRSLLLPDLASRKSVEYTADFELGEFCERYVPTMRGSDTERITQCARANGWKEGLDFFVGHRMVWLAYPAWKMVEDGLRAVEKEQKKMLRDGDEDESVIPDDNTDFTHGESTAPHGGYYEASNDNLLLTRTGTNGSRYQDANAGSRYAQGGLLTPNLGNSRMANDQDNDDGGWGTDWDKKDSGYPNSPPVLSKEKGLIVNPAPNTVEEVPTSTSRRVWLWMVWGFTWWMPSFLLRVVGRMKRPDVRLAWREKFTIAVLILVINATVIFYIVEFGRLLCPNFDKAWSVNEVGQHTGDNDFWVAVQGRVYDVSKFIHGDHSDIQGLVSNSLDALDGVAGQDLTQYFPPPLVLACSDLVHDATVALRVKNVTTTIVQAMHTSGKLQTQTTKLAQADWYTSTFLPKMRNYYKGPLVWDRNKVAAYAEDQDMKKVWAIWENGVYDLTDYINTLTIFSGDLGTYQFLNTDVTDVFRQQSGQDITKNLNAVFGGLDANVRNSNINCLKNAFYVGDTDFRKTPRCLVQNYMLLVFSSILVASMVLKFLAALQLSPKRNPEMLDKFVICQIPCYTEGEDSLRRTIDSLASLKYDDKRKLLFIICDGNIIGSGNDRTTPRIVLDILGIDPKLDPEPLLFKSVGEGSKALNYGKVYSGLYEFEGHVVP